MNSIIKTIWLTLFLIKKNDYHIVKNIANEMLFLNFKLANRICKDWIMINGKLLSCSAKKTILRQIKAWNLYNFSDALLLQRMKT